MKLLRARSRGSPEALQPDSPPAPPRPPGNIRRFLRWYWSRRWRRWALYLGIPAFLIGNVALVEATSQSGFCNNCHIMEPYYTSWDHGPHKNVECIKCHISPGISNFVAAKLNGLGQVVDDVLQRTSTKPSASVSQLSCTRGGCHSVKTLSSKQTNNGRFKFDHSKHLGLEYAGLKLECGACHAHIKGDQHFEINTAACITCHLTERAPAATQAAVPGLPPLHPANREATPILMVAREPVAGKAGKTAPLPAGEPATGPKAPPNTCSTCHDAPTGKLDYNGVTVDHAEYLSYGASCESCHRGVTAKPAPIDDAKCLACHTFGVEKSLPVEEMHKVHAEGRHKVECFSCHGVTQHGPPAQLLSLEQFDCRSCHQAQHEIQRSTYLFNDGAPVHDPKKGDSVVSPMFMTHVDCTGCHVEQHELRARPGSGATVARPTPQACDRCHAPGLGEKMIPLWQRDTRALHDAVQAELDAAPAPADEAAAKLLQEARQMLELVRVDGSWGVHNPLYTQHLMERAREKIRQAGPQPPAPPSPISAAIPAAEPGK